MASETDVQRHIQLEVGSRLDTRLFRNNVGVLRDEQGNYVRYGLCPGSSDLIGWKSVTITPDMVGQTLAVFVALECKKKVLDRWRPKITEREKSQWAFIDRVRAMGGLADMVDSLDSALTCITARDSPKT